MSKVPKETCQHLIISSNDGVIEAISEVCRNLLNNNIPIDEDLKKKLAPHASIIRKIAKKRKTKNKKKLIVNQKGGLSFLPGLLAALIPSVLSLFNIKM